MAYKKVPLTGIKTLTFYSGKSTTARRGKPIPQLTCAGSACKLFQPDVVQCVNMGDDGLGGVQWRCDTDLPSSLRMGKVDVSCEGWAKAGDQNVLQGSCGLTYDLHRVNKGLEYGENPHGPSSFTSDSFANKAFNLLFYAISAILLYSLIRSLLLRFSPRNAPPPLSNYFPSSGGAGGGGGGGPGFNNPHGGGGGGGGGSAPPPYTKNPSEYVPPAQGQGWNPGFWTGLGAGALGTYLTARSRGDPQAQAQAQTQRGYGQPQFYNTRRRMVDSFDDDDDRGIGSSRTGTTGGLGEMRRATGFGGSSTR